MAHKNEVSELKPRNFLEIPEIPEIRIDRIRGKFGLKTSIIPIGGTSMKVTSDVYDNVIRNTDIEVNPGFLCTVKGEDLYAFIDELHAIVNKYKI